MVLCHARIGGDHFSGTGVAAGLKQPTRGARAVRLQFRAGTLRIFGLAAGGVCRAIRVTPDAVRSYRTFSPLPAWKPGVSLPAVSFLWHFPSVLARPTNAGPSRLDVIKHRALKNPPG